MHRGVPAGLFLALVLVVPAAAAVPNDTPASAIEISVGTTVTEDTTTSDTTDSAETALNQSCGTATVQHGVWFDITPTADGFIAFDTTDSNYLVGVTVFLGTPTAGSVQTCGTGRVITQVTSGQTYFVMTYGFDVGSGTSGTMILKAQAALAPPVITLTIDKTGTVDRISGAQITGRVTCTGVGTVSTLSGNITQPIGRTTLIKGSFQLSLSIPCDGASHSWAASVSGDNGVLGGGKASVTAIAAGCNTDACSQATATATVRLRGGGS